MLVGSHEQGAERHGLGARDTLSLVSTFTPVTSLTRPAPTNSNTDSDSVSPTLSLNPTSISVSTGASDSQSGSSSTSSSVTSASPGRPTTSSLPIPIPSSSATSMASGSSTSTQSSSSTSSSTSSLASGSTNGSSIATSTSASTTGNNMSSTSSTPSGSSTGTGAIATGGSHVKTGAIVGGVIGGVVFVTLLIAGILLYLRIRRQVPSRSRRRSMGEFDSGRPAGPWAGLSSRDNTVEAVAAPPRSHQRSGSRSYPQADSMGMVVSPTNSSAGHGKYSLSSSEEAAAAAGHGRRRSEYIETVQPLDYVPHLSGTETSPRRARKPSNGSSTRAVALAKLNTAAANSSGSTTATTISNHSRQRSSDRGAHAYAGPGSSTTSTPIAVSHPRGAPTSPSSPTSPTNPYGVSAEPMSRSTSTNVGGVRRNPTRKPVPSYHSSVSAASTEREKRQSAASTPQGVTPAHSREDLRRLNVLAPELNHKSSFGESKPVHYLVPDLPPLTATPPRK